MVCLEDINFSRDLTILNRAQEFKKFFPKPQNCLTFFNTSGKYRLFKQERSSDNHSFVTDQVGPLSGGENKDARKLGKP